MAIKGIYVADGTTKYTSADVKLVNGKIVGGKIIYGDTDLKVEAQSSPDMSVKVSAGLCSINGVFLQNDSSYTVTITSNSSSYSRKDAIVAYISGTTFQIKAVAGTPSASPIAPTVSSSNYIKLAEVTVGVGVTSIQSTAVKDCRTENNQSIMSSLSEIVADLYNYRVVYSDGSADRGYRKHADGFTYAWNSGIQNIAGNALSINVTLPYTFQNTNCCRATARFNDSNSIPHVLACKFMNGNTVMIYKPASSTPTLANGNGSWYIQVEGF